MRINIHAGHNPSGRIACGAVGFLNESDEARKVKNEVIYQLRALGHTVFDCTCDNGTSQRDVLKKIVEKCNSNQVDVDLSIHFNSGVDDKVGNNKTTGVEAWVYSEKSSSVGIAETLCDKISRIGFRNRGVQYSQSLYVLKHTKSPAVLLEVCFVDDKDDANLYNYYNVSCSIVKALVGTYFVDSGTPDEKVPEEEEKNPNSNASNKKLYRVQCGAYQNYSNAINLQTELQKAGFDCFITS